MNRIKVGPEAAQVPSPPHPQQRQEPLPWHQPKPSLDDPGAPSRIRRLLDSPSYRPADRDLDYLSEYESRGVRLQIDYEKPELLLEQHGIRHTLVVFGSTRICEPASARRTVEELRRRLACNPDEADLQSRLAIAERLLAKARFYEVARELGQLVARSGAARDGLRLFVMTGGGPGMMEAANRGAWDAGSPTIGLNISLPHEQYPNPYITPDLCFRFHYFAIRKLHFLLRTRALVVLPGGFGTFDELFETLTLIQTRTIRPIPVVLVGKAYWQRAFDVEFLVDEGVIDREDRDLFWYAETAEEIWRGILQWYAASGTPLIAESADPVAKPQTATTEAGELR